MAARERMSAKDQEDGKGIRLLLVDDEAGFVDVLSNRLARRNFDVTKTYSGSEAIQALRREDFDVAILDVKMEDMDGIEVLKVFKKMVPKMAVIMLTGHGSEQAARDGIEFGAFDYLMKPCDIKVLMQKLDAAMERRQDQIDKAIDAKTQDIILRHGE